MRVKNVEDANEELYFAREWDMIENEGPDTRYDWGFRSFWVRSDGSVEGDIPTSVKAIIKAYS